VTAPSTTVGSGSEKRVWGTCARQCHGQGLLKAVWKRRAPSTATCNRSTSVEPMERILAQISPRSNSPADTDQLPCLAIEPLTDSKRIVRAQKKQSARESDNACLSLAMSWHPRRRVKCPATKTAIVIVIIAATCVCVKRLVSGESTRRVEQTSMHRIQQPVHFSKKTAAHSLAPRLNRSRAHLLPHARLGVDLHRL